MAENNSTITNGDTSMVEQYLDTFRRSEHLEPEKSLLAAILEYCGGNDWIFSFDNVCELLGLDPEYVRRGLRETLGRPAEEEKSVHRDRMRRRAA
jgi:hypothetical protein